MTIEEQKIYDVLVDLSGIEPKTDDVIEAIASGMGLPPVDEDSHFTNRKWLYTLSDEELAGFLIQSSGHGWYYGHFDGTANTREDALQRELAWLRDKRQPVYKSQEQPMTEEQQLAELSKHAEPDEARKIYNSGYRKADTVRKQVAEYLIQKVSDYLFPEDHSEVTISTDFIYGLAKEFGLDVEERQEDTSDE